VLVSFVYVLGCRVLEFVVLLLRGERSKELEIVVLRVGFANSSAAFRAVGFARFGDLGVGGGRVACSGRSHIWLCGICSRS
jgi:hypothetical protein